MWTEDTLWDLRNEIRLGSLYTNDYRNSYGVKPRACQDFFDSFIDYYESERYEKDSPYYQSEDDWFYDNPEDLWDYYLFYEDEPLPTQTVGESKNRGKKKVSEVYEVDGEFNYNVDTWDVIDGLKKYCSQKHDLDAVENGLYYLETLATTEHNKDRYEPLYRFLVDVSGNL